MMSTNNDPREEGTEENEPDDSSDSFSASAPDTDGPTAADEQSSADMIAEGGRPTDYEDELGASTEEHGYSGNDEDTVQTVTESNPEESESSDASLETDDGVEDGDDTSADGAQAVVPPSLTYNEPQAESTEEPSVSAESQSNQGDTQDSSPDALAKTTPQFRGAFLAGWGIAAVALLSIGGYGIYNATQTTVPQAPVYFAADDAKATDKSCAEFEKADLNCEVFTKDSYDIPGGGLIEQSTDAGSRIKKDSTIKIIYSAGPQFGEMPDITGLPLDTASTELSKQRIKVADTKKVDNSGLPAGHVVSSNVRDGAVTEKDQEVNLTISSGVTSAPDFEDMSADQALKEATDAGLKAEINWVEGPAPYGVVVAQSVQAGEEITDGMITVDVKRPYDGASLQIPDIVGESQDKALETLYDSGITMLNIVEVEGDKDEVLSVSPSESQYVSSSQVVTVVISTTESD